LVEYLILTEECKIIKLFGYIRMVLPKDLLSNLQRPLAEWFCFLVLPTFAIKNSQIVKCCGHL
jgi:Na+/H+ antiporter NhaA